MIIRVKITKPANQAFFEVPNGTIVNVDLDEYTSGVLAGEVYASWPGETFNAQIVATIKMSYVLTKKKIWHKQQIQHKKFM